jgi:hypothetical protein
VAADGTVEKLMVAMSGASKLLAEALQAKTAQLSISGAGKADVSVSDSLKVAISEPAR